MNPFQEVILDRLVGAGSDEFTDELGPLAMAFQALIDAGLIEADASALSLGYPLLLSAALDSGIAMLWEVEDKRQLALQVFSAVPPRPDVTEMPAQQQIKAALWCAQRVHPLVCRADCPYLLDAAAEVAHHCEGTPRAEEAAAGPRSFACGANTNVVWDAVANSMITLRCLAFHTIDKVVEAAQAAGDHDAAVSASRYSASYAGRIVAHFLGGPGAAALCVDLAHELGVGTKLPEQRLTSPKRKRGKR